MTQEEKDLLLKDLCARLPYGVVGVNSAGFTSPLIVKGEAAWDILTSLNYRIVKYGWKPYLRPMSGMTEEEEKEFQEIKLSYHFDEDSYILFDWLNKKGFDYRGLIPKGLALEAQEGMYK